MRKILIIIPLLVFMFVLTVLPEEPGQDDSNQQAVNTDIIKANGTAIMFKPLIINTDTIKATGIAIEFKPLAVTTACIKATGITFDFKPVIIRTEKLKAVGKTDKKKATISISPAKSLNKNR